MAKPLLMDEDSRLESEIIQCLIAGLHEWRSDLSYPESHSDFQGCVRNLFRMYEVKRRDKPAALRLKCDECNGLGRFRTKTGERQFEEKRCDKCEWRGWVEG